MELHYADLGHRPVPSNHLGLAGFHGSDQRVIKRTCRLLRTAVSLLYILCYIRRQGCSCCLWIYSIVLFRDVIPQIIPDLRVLHAAPAFVDLIGPKRLGEFRSVCCCIGSYAGGHVPQLITSFMSELPILISSDITHFFQVTCTDTASSPT